MKISRKTLVIASVIADAVELLTVAFWGGTQWFPFLETPVIVLHFMYAGPKAALAMFDLIPGLGLLPLYTIAALLYKDPKYARDADPKSTVVVDTGVPGSKETKPRHELLDQAPPL
jgi:hypothetical protein